MKRLFKYFFNRKSRESEVVAKLNEQYGKVISFMICEYEDAMAQMGVSKRVRDQVKAQAVKATQRFARVSDRAPGVK